MTLSEPAARDMLHRRDIAVCGFQRADGLFDVEARLTDTRNHGFSSADRGQVSDEPLHGMAMRMTFGADLVITAVEAQIEYSPYAICPAAADNFSRLTGLRIGPGFLRAAAERVGGTRGCTHLRELLQQMATVAIQTMFSARNPAPGQTTSPKGLLNTCHAYSSAGPVVRRRWPDHYTGPEPAAGSAPPA